MSLEKKLEFEHPLNAYFYVTEISLLFCIWKNCSEHIINKYYPTALKFFDKLNMLAIPTTTTRCKFTLVSIIIRHDFSKKGKKFIWEYDLTVSAKDLRLLSRVSAVFGL